MSCIDVREIEAKYRDQPGNPAYPRRMLLRLLVQAAIDGVWSSRKIDKLAHENVRMEYNLVCSAHNLKIIWGKLSRDAAGIGTILGSVTNLTSKVKNFLGFRPVIDLKCQS